MGGRPGPPPRAHSERVTSAASRATARQAALGGPSANPWALVLAERAAPRGVADQSFPPVEEGLPPGAGSGSLMRAGG